MLKYSNHESEPMICLEQGVIAADCSDMEDGMKQIKILAPCGILGYGFPKESFMNGMAEKPDAIVVDAGSTDAGPHKLGKGVAIVSDEASRRDLELIITEAAKAGIPAVIGSAGGAGGRVHVERTMRIIASIVKEHHLEDMKTVVIWADIPKAFIKEKCMRESWKNWETL